MILNWLTQQTPREWTMIDDPAGNPCGHGGDCSKAESLVDKYVDNQLDPTEALFISQHLIDCPGCNHGFQFESLLHTRIRSVSPIHMPVELKEKILLSLGFPGISDPVQNSFSASDLDAKPIDSPNFSIPKGEIPRGQIPSGDIFSTDPNSSDQQAEKD